MIMETYGSRAILSRELEPSLIGTLSDIWKFEDFPKLWELKIFLQVFKNFW